MKNRIAMMSLLLGSGLAAAIVAGVMPVQGAAVTAAAVHTSGWNEEAAAHALDARETWWQNWPHAQKDHGTVCVSCHTVLPYAMARPRLGHRLGEAAMPAQETAMMASVEKRVAQWGEMTPFYSDAHDGVGKTAESHATEAVLNAVILASFDIQQGKLRSITRTALDEVWALQEESGERAGGWKWQDFHLAPWESPESAYQGAALLLRKVELLPDGYAQSPGVREHVARQTEYLQRQYATQPVMNQLYLLWASAGVPGLMTPDDKKALVAKVRALQQPDGGWRTMAIDPGERRDGSPEPSASDGYATGLVVLAMQAAGDSASDAGTAAGVRWLGEHQQADGTWAAASINKQRAVTSDAALFMNDAATGYAVMALLESER